METEKRTYGEVVEYSMTHYYLSFYQLFDFCSNVFEEWCYPSAYTLLPLSLPQMVYISSEI
jgi:hypothetical protein